MELERSSGRENSVNEWVNKSTHLFDSMEVRNGEHSADSIGDCTVIVTWKVKHDKHKKRGFELTTSNTMI